MPQSQRLAAIVSTVTCLLVVLVPDAAEAFCGFYVSGSNEGLYNNATRASLLRDGNTTVLSMQNNYEGPPKDFAMVVPVPVVLEKKQVKTLDDAIFEKLDDYTAPRLVEYWERDPCKPRPRPRLRRSASSSIVADTATGSAGGGRSVVTVEAQFKVGEYDIVVLSSEESTALEKWLHAHDYNIPKGAAKYLEPYIQQGTYFFVARVDMQKVQYRDGEAILSPLRFHYETDTFKLPVRLGLINSKGSQNLIVYTLGKRQRYKVANRQNVAIPTNIRVGEKVKDNFAGFYTELFDRVMQENPRAVVTEYSWRMSKCDPCPRQPLDKEDLVTLGADVTAGTEYVYESDGGPSDPFETSDPETEKRTKKKVHDVDPNNWVVTRLHTKYTSETLGKDLVFEEAEPIRGGRGMPEGDDGVLPEGEPRESAMNNFQGRYVILHPWEGDVDCEDPRHGVWGGPNETPRAGGGPEAKAAGDVGFSKAKPRPLSEFVEQDEIPGLKQSTKEYDERASFPPEPSKERDSDEGDD